MYSCLLPDTVHMWLLPWHDQELFDIALNWMVKRTTSKECILVDAHAKIPYHIHEYSIAAATAGTNGSLHDADAIIDRHGHGDGNMNASVSVPSFQVLGGLTRLKGMFMPSSTARSNMTEEQETLTMPKPRTVLATRFRGVPVRKVNFSEWLQVE